MVAMVATGKPKPLTSHRLYLNGAMCTLNSHKAYYKAQSYRKLK